MRLTSTILKKKYPAQILTNFDRSIDADPNRNYDILEHTITSAINKHIPTKTIKYNKHKHNKSNWIHKGTIKSIKYIGVNISERKSGTERTKRPPPGGATGTEVHRLDATRILTQLR